MTAVSENASDECAVKLREMLFQLQCNQYGHRGGHHHQQQLESCEPESDRNETLHRETHNENIPNVAVPAFSVREIAHAEDDDRSRNSCSLRNHRTPSGTLPRMERLRPAPGHSHCNIENITFSKFDDDHSAAAALESLLLHQRHLL